MIMNHPRLARAVFAFLNKKGCVPRSELNKEFGTTSDDKKQEALSLILRSLIVFGHIERHFDSDLSVVHFWPKGFPSQFTADEGVKNKTSDLEDWLMKPINQGVDVAPKVTTPPVTQPYSSKTLPPKKPYVPPEVAAEAETALYKALGIEKEEKKPDVILVHSEITVEELVDHKHLDPNDTEDTRPEMTTEEQLASLRQMASVMTADAFIVSLAQTVPFFTLQDVNSFLLKHLKQQVISMRLALLVRWRKLYVGYHHLSGVSYYWHPSAPVPPNVTPCETNSEPRPKNRKTPPVRNVPRDEWPEVDQILVPHTSVPTSPLLPLVLDKPLLSLNSDGDLSLRRDNGETIVLTTREKLVLVGTLRNVNLEVLYLDLKFQVERESQE